MQILSAPLITKGMRSPFFRRSATLILRVGVLAAVLLATNAGRAAGSKRRDPNIAIRFHSQVSTFDPSFAARVTAGNPPRELLVEKIPSLSERDIAAFYPYKAADGTFSAAFQLDRHGAAVLETISAQNRGRYIVAAINARPVALLAIDKKITDGIIFIPYGLTLDEVHKLGESFSLMGETDTDKENKKLPKESTFSGPGNEPR